jgi:TetR/AcrR family tetracycline transcriptional repressor
VALEILDAEGLDHVTLRKISSKLGIQAASLYWHFKDKQDIIGDMAQAILSTDELSKVTAPKNISDWSKWLTDLAHSIRSALIAHREGGRVVAGASFFRANTLAKIANLSTEVLVEVGFTPLNASIATSTIFDYVWGFVIEEQSHSAMIETENPEDTSSQKEASDIRSLVNVNLWRQIMDDRDKLTPTGEFDCGLELIINGLKSTLRGPQAP